MKLSVELEKWRIDRPDEWKMDEFVRNAAKLESERDALASQVEALITAEPDWAKLGAILGEKQANAFKLQREQHLAERDAQKGLVGFIAGADWLWTNGLTIKPYNLENCKVEAANEYADSIRQGVK